MILYLASKRGSWLVNALGLLIGMLIAFPTTILSGFEFVQTNVEDAEHLHYVLEHTWRWASDPAYRPTFWSPAFFYPERNVLAYSENLCGAAPIYWALRLGFDESISLQGWILIVSALNYLSMYLVLRWLGVEAILAALGGILFAFCLPRQVQVDHLLLLPQYCSPLALYFFWRFSRQPERGSLALFLTFAAWQLFSGIYLGWFLHFALGIWLLILIGVDHSVIGRWREFFGRRWRFVGVAMAAFGIVVGSFVQHYYIANGAVRRDYLESVHFAPPISHWFSAPAHTLWGQALVQAETSDDSESFLFAGLGFYALLATAFFFGWHNRRSPQWADDARLALSTSLACFVLMLITLNFGVDLSLWQFVHGFVPGANAIRAIGRVCFVVLLLALPGGIVAVDRLLKHFVHSDGWRIVLCIILLIACCGEQWRSERETVRRADFASATSKLAQELTNADVAYISRDPTDASSLPADEVLCMWAGLKSNVPVVNGYTSREPERRPSARGAAMTPEDIVTYLGDAWSGRLLLVYPGPIIRKQYCEVQPGGHIHRKTKSD